MLPTSADPDMIEKYIEKLNFCCNEQKSTAFIPWEGRHLVSGGSIYDCSCADSLKLCKKCEKILTKFIDEANNPRVKSYERKAEIRMTDLEASVKSLQDYWST